MIPQIIEEVESENIFDSPNEVEEIETKKKTLVVKKKKKKNKVGEYQKNDSLRPEFSSFSKNMNRESVVNWDGRTYQQIIEQSKKPKRMPPSMTSQIIENANEDSKEEVSRESNLVYHVKRALPINTVNKKRKHLFVNEQLDGLQGENEDVVTGENEKKKKKSHRSPIKAKSNIFEDKMMKFLKEKYREEPEKEEEMAKKKMEEGAQVNLGI